MLLWYVSSVIILLVVVPLVVFLAHGLLRATLQIRRYADDVLVNGVTLTGTLDAVPKLVDTANLATATRQLVGQYDAALKRLL